MQSNTDIMGGISTEARGGKFWSGFAPRSGGFAIRQPRISAFTMRNTCATTYKSIIFADKTSL